MAPNAVPTVQVATATQTTSTIFQMTCDTLHVPVDSLSRNDHIRFLENIKQGFKRKTSWKSPKTTI